MSSFQLLVRSVCSPLHEHRFFCFVVTLLLLGLHAYAQTQGLYVPDLPQSKLTDVVAVIDNGDDEVVVTIDDDDDCTFKNNGIFGWV